MNAHTCIYIHTVIYMQCIYDFGQMCLYITEVFITNKINVKLVTTYLKL